MFVLCEAAIAVTQVSVFLSPSTTNSEHEFPSDNIQPNTTREVDGSRRTIEPGRSMSKSQRKRPIRAKNCGHVCVCSACVQFGWLKTLLRL